MTAEVCYFQTQPHFAVLHRKYADSKSSASRVEDLPLQGKVQERATSTRARAWCDVCTPPTVKGTRWIPHVHRALKVFLRHGADKDLTTNHGQYFTVLQHMEHLAVAGSVEVHGPAKKVSFTQYMKLKKIGLSQMTFQT